MIEGQAQRHHVARYDAILDDGGFLHDPPDAEDGALRQVDDRREGVDGEHSEVGDGERRAAHLLGG